MNTAETSNHKSVSVKATVAQVRAVMLFAGKNNPRYYLNGLFIERRKGTLRLIASDGHTLAVLVLDRDGGPDFSAIAPRGLFDNLPKSKQDQDNLVTLNLEKVDDPSEPYTITVQYSGKNMKTSTINEAFPDYRSVFPAGEPSGEVAQFNPQLLGRCQKAVDLLGSKGFYVHHNGPNKAAIVTTSKCPDFVALVMPWRQGSATNPLAAIQD